MTALPLQTIIEDHPRLARRLDSSDNPSVAEILPLIRATLVARGYRSVSADVPELATITPPIWEAHGFTAVGPAQWKAEPWLPSWLDHHGTPPDEAVARQERRRPDWRLSADPFYSDSVNHHEYLSPGQKAAVRAVSTAQAGDAIICVLPTGSGKTDVVLTRAITRRPRQTCLVVPTVALALDLERRIRSLTNDITQFAYHGNLTPDTKAEIARRVLDGTQWLVITSPEAACTVLARPLEAAASEGRLDLLAIDEAHIVADWGDDFRPEFQSLSGLRRRLVDRAPADQRPVTVMLTATLDDYGLETLRRLFPGDRELLVSAQATRPEPAWWMSRCETEEEKRQRFLEVCRHLPRPFIVYTTLHTSQRSTNVRTVLEWLQSEGFRAIEGVTGGEPRRTPRNKVVEGLSLRGNATGDIDIVVATSAFGLGMDIPGIRGVVHLCVPESVDRLYQEVGRSGRDGNASASIVLWTETDAEVARDLAEARLIGAQKAWKRWRSMSTDETNGDLLHVDLTAATDDVKYPWSDANHYWNLQTLSAMDRAGMIKLDWPTPPVIPADATDEELHDVFAAHHRSTAVRILQSDLADETRFQQRFRDAQSRSRKAAAASLQSATAIMDGLTTCVNRYLADHYRLNSGSSLFAAVSQCGGCPACRAAGSRPLASLSPIEPLFDGLLTLEPKAILRDLAPDGKLCLWTDGPQPKEEREVVKRLVALGVTALVSTDTWTLPPRNADRIWWEARVADVLASEEVVRVPTLVRIQDDDLTPTKVALLLSKLSRGPLTVVLTRSDQLSPFDDRVLLRESWGPAYHVDHILRRL